MGLLNVDFADMSTLVNTGVTQTVSVDEGHAAIFNISAIDSYPPATIKWFSSTGSRIPLESLQYHVTFSNQLIVLSTQLDRDNGSQFRFNASNTYAGLTSSGPSFSLNVRSK
jgi:hypothetical protein